MALFIHEAAEPMRESLAARDWFGFSQENTLLQYVDYGSNSTMGWEPPLPRGPPLWVSFTKQGFYGFKPTICAPCCSNTHEILQCSDGKYFPDYAKEHINMRNDSLWCWNDPTFDYYAPDLEKHPSFRWADTQQPFEQPNVPQCSEQCDIIQPSQCVESHNMLEDIEIKEPLASDPCPMEETTPDDAEISQEFVLTQFHTPYVCDRSPKTDFNADSAHRK
ncbi:hypothetical protein D8674_026063 [Pyrus ussuriensis x Pyrus communis]|uniref:Uncharacterized protein n=1 Tax=Pyrus ussuriensis x Pyrus communis TaxID=2448454 RepID=A0A5N5I728_9ROSA|nr:hypothetical protein D8674_026063 [Pyrus ussuriensis x Pyrus communis]